MRKFNIIEEGRLSKGELSNLKGGECTHGCGNGGYDSSLCKLYVKCSNPYINCPSETDLFICPSTTMFKGCGTASYNSFTNLQPYLGSNLLKL
jgi:hypothetical protein